MTDACKYSPDIFFLSLFLFFGTFFMCSALKRFKFTPYFPAKVIYAHRRRNLALEIIIGT